MRTGKSLFLRKNPMSKTDKEKSIPALSIKSLASQVPEFDLPATIVRQDGSKVEITLRARAMRKSEWIAMRDEHLQALRDTGKPDEDEFSFARLVNERSSDAAALVCKGVAGWSLQEEFTAANLLAAEDVAPGAINAFLSAYDAALFHGRVGN